MEGAAGEADCKRECAIEECNLCGRQRADEIRERGSRKAHELVAMNTALVLQPLVRADVDLSVNAIAT
jgi:hypothetical protein